MSRTLALAAALSIAAWHSAHGQGVVACDFDIEDNAGLNVWGNTIHLTGRAGAGTNTGTFVIINGNTPESDVDHDGYSTNCDFRNLIISQKTILTNTRTPSLAIPAENLIITAFPKILPNGVEARVNVQVEVPPNTVAGTYRGRITVRDDSIFATVNSIGEPLNLDFIEVEVTVVDQFAFGIVNADSPNTLDSLVVRGRAGTTANGVLRVANTGNAPLNEISVTATDLRSESAVGIVIPAQNIHVTPGTAPSLLVSDTMRVTVSVDVPAGILGGRYRGLLTVSAQGAPAQQIPLIVIVTSSRGIVFENNPVRNANGVARIAFNGDPGTDYQVGIFEMNGLMVYTTTGTVFAGLTPAGAQGTAQAPAAGADFAVNVSWPLVNGRGEGVASGTYLVVVESTVNGQRQLARDKLIVIR